MIFCGGSGGPKLRGVFDPASIPNVPRHEYPSTISQTARRQDNFALKKEEKEKEKSSQKGGGGVRLMVRVGAEPESPKWAASST